MNPQTPMETQPELLSYTNVALTDREVLAGWGFDPRKIASLLWLWQRSSTYRRCGTPPSQSSRRVSTLSRS